MPRVNEIYKEIKEPFSMQQWGQLIDGLDQISHLNFLFRVCIILKFNFSSGHGYNETQCIRL